MAPVEPGTAARGVVERLHALLVAAVRERRGAQALHGPVTVAEIYQDLVPYRSVRSALGLDMNADYEHTLLRLLSGEGGLARLDPATAREQIARELESPNPNVALYRKFAGCDVVLQDPGTQPPAWVDETLSDEEEPALDEPVAPAQSNAVEEGWRTLGTMRDEPEEPALFDAAEAEPEPEPDLAAEAELPPVVELPAVAEAAVAESAVGATEPVRRESAAGPAPATARCAFCDSTLPRGRSVRYCPYCGADQDQHPCPSCGEPVDPEWAFCVACGEPQGA